MTTITLPDLARLREHGYKVEHYTGTGGGWMLVDPDGDNLMIGNHGCVAPTKWEAVAEGLRRIAQDERIEQGGQPLWLDDNNEALLRAALACYREKCSEYAATESLIAIRCAQHPELANGHEHIAAEWRNTVKRIDALEEKLG